MNEGELKLIFTGDIAPIGYAESKPGNSYQLSIDDRIGKLFLDHHLRICNLEAPLTYSDTEIDKSGPHLKAHPESVKLLSDLKIDIACLSNNHIRDYGDQGVRETIDICRTNGILTVGAGINIGEAAKPLIIERQGFKIALFNFSETEFNTANIYKAGSNPDDPIHIWNSINEYKKNVDFLVVVMHGGKEMYPYPTPHQYRLYHFLVDLGVNLVVGHHSHVIGGYELYKGVPIFYSLGNFIFDDSGNTPEWYVGVLLSMKIDMSLTSKIDFNLIPYVQCKGEPSVKLIEEGHQSDFDIYKKLNTNINSVLVDEKWDDYLKRHYQSYIKSVLSLSLAERVLVKLNIFNKYIFLQNRLLRIQNFLKCQTHRFTAISSISYYFDKKNN